MEIRQKDAARDMENRDINLRTTGSDTLRSGYTSGEGKTEERGNKSSSFHGESGQQQTLTPEETREMIAQLSPEERKQWISYSDHEKQKLLKDVERKVDRKMRLRPQTVSSERLAGNREQTTQAYRINGTDRKASSGRRTSGGIRKVDQEKIDSYVERTDSNSSRSKGQTQQNKTYGRTVTPKSRAAVFTQERSNDKVSAVEETRKRSSSSRSVQKEDFTQDRDSEGRRYREDRKSQTEMRQKEPAEGMALKQNEKSIRAAPEDDLKEKRQEKHKKEEHSERKKEFFNEFEHTLSADSRKRQNINNAIKEEQISQAELEYETGADALRTATTPLRTRVSGAVNRATRRIASAVAGFLKYFALFGGIFLLFMLLIMFISALLGGLAGEEQDTSSTLYTANGQEIVEYAKEWIGITRYVWGYGRDSETDWQDYADCSSFVHGVYSHFGIQLGWDTYAMESNGEVLEGGISEAVPGDIILYYSGSIAPNQSAHVAIYAGDGEVVHCSGGRANNTPANAGRGVCMSTVDGAASGRPYEVRRVISNVSTGTGGYNIDPTNYTMEELELIWAIVNQEDNGSYEGALAVISTAMNRVDSPQWSSLGSNALEQLTAPGQFCYSIDNNWRQWLGGNVQSYVIQAVSDCLNGGIRNHNYTSFRSYYTEGSEQIGGGNYYF